MENWELLKPLGPGYKIMSKVKLDIWTSGNN